MGETTKKRLTVTDLMKEKEKFQTKNDEVAVVFVERLNAEVVIRKPEKSLCVDALRMNRDKDNDTDADVYMVYNTMTEPDLKNKDLQKEFGCVLPTDIVEKIFEPGEIASLSEMAFDLAKYKDGGVTIVKKLIESDDDFYFLHHYVQKGRKLDELLNLSYDEKLFMTASLDKELEERNKYLKAGAMVTVPF